MKAEWFSQGAENNYAQDPGVNFPVDDGLRERRYLLERGSISHTLAGNGSYGSNAGEGAAGSQVAVRVEGDGIDEMHPAGG